MTADQIAEYLWKPWKVGAVGPDAYDCWGLLRAVRLAHFGGGIPACVLGDEARALHAEKLRSGEWEIVQVPVHGDGVLMREGSEPHVGIYLDIDGGGVLHAMRGHGVIFTHMRELRIMGFGRCQFYRIYA